MLVAARVTEAPLARNLDVRDLGLGVGVSLPL